MAVNISFVRRMLKLLKEFAQAKLITPDEFVENKLKGKKTIEKVYEDFLVLMRHRRFFEGLVQSYWTSYQLKPFNKELIMTLMYVIIFMLHDGNCDETARTLLNSEYRFAYKVAEYFTKEDNQTDLAQIACKSFDNEYVLQRILDPVLNKLPVIEEVCRAVAKELEAKTKIVPKPPTVPEPPSCYGVKQYLFNAPPNTPAPQFKSVPVSQSVLTGDSRVQKALGKAFMENRENARKLLETARKSAFKCADVPKKTPTPEQPPPVYVIKRNKPPPKKDVEIKRNAATYLREAAVLAKEAEIEIKRMEALMTSAFDPAILEGLDAEMRKCVEQQRTQDIERKHLQGLLTYEEAILAKQNLVAANRQKMEEFKEERLKILEEIDRWKEEEQEKIKVLVEKSQNIVKAARDAGKKLQVARQTQARVVDVETREMLRIAYEKQREELACRVRLIQELRALQQVKAVHVKEFDPTESPNFGLLCEMSIAELQERLALLKVELQEELKRRQARVVESRQKQQELIESVKQFIDQNRVAKPKPVPRSSCKLEQTPEIISLRERLQQAKEMRMNMQSRLSA